MCCAALSAVDVVIRGNIFGWIGEWRRKISQIYWWELLKACVLMWVSLVKS